MTCRHKPGDPRCTAGNSPDALRKKAIRDYKRWVLNSSENPGDPLNQKPDNSNRTILAATEVGPHLALKVEYPSCPNCSYEGIKIMVYLNHSLGDAIKWRQIDPHFREIMADDPHIAPPPHARFCPTEQGWKDALAFLKSKAPGDKDAAMVEELRALTRCSVLQTTACNPETGEHGALCWVICCGEEDGGTGEFPKDVMNRLRKLPLIFEVFDDGFYAFHEE